THAVTLTLLSTGSSFQNGGQTLNQKSVGAALDQASASASGDFANVLNLLYGLGTTQGPQALNALNGQSYAGFGSLMIQGSLLFMNSFSLHAGAGGGVSYQALNTGVGDACGETCDVEPLWGVWGGGVGAFGTVAGDGNANGLTYNLGGFVAGLDRKF